MGILYKLFLNFIFIHLDLSNSVVNILSLKVEKSTSFFLSVKLYIFYKLISSTVLVLVLIKLCCVSVMLLLMFICIWQKASKVHWRLGQCFCRASHELVCTSFLFCKFVLKPIILFYYVID